MTFWAEKRKAARPVPGLFLELREAKEAGAGEDHEGPRGVNLSLSPKAAKRRWSAGEWQAMWERQTVGWRGDNVRPERSCHASPSREEVTTARTKHWGGGS